MKEAAITKSPYAYEPREVLTKEEKEKLYRLRIDETFRAYTVFDVLTKVYHRSFSDDLIVYLGAHPEEFREFEAGWRLSRAWVNELTVIRSESVFFQPVDNFRVDILVEARIKMEESKKDDRIRLRKTSIKKHLRLQYTFNFTPCRLECRFVKAILREEDSLQKEKDNLAVDKYLVPVMSGDDYEKIAWNLHQEYFPMSLFGDVTIDPLWWLMGMNRKVCIGTFPENGALGEYFFGFGTADLVDPDTGEERNEYINPGTIVINRELLDSPRTLRSTMAHEGTHSYLGRWFFRLQMTHGHDYCSYMCKRNTGESEQAYASPLEIMEIQANILPRYLMIPEYYGKKHAAALLESYGGDRTLPNMRRLVDDMAEYYGTTKTMARSRLMDFGYNEARGILRTANGSLVPSYYSTLSKDETYAISEKDALEEYVRNPEFREVLRTGRYLYIAENACYCLNERKYIYRDHLGRPHLRSYAREHMNECCLVFKETYTNAFFLLVNGIIAKNLGSTKGRKRIQYVGKNGESPLTEEGLQLRRQIEKQVAEQAMVEMSFNDMTVKLMDQRKVSVEMLAEKTGLSVDTIKRLRNKPDIAFPIQTIVAVCIALHLYPQTSGEYIRRSPTKLTNTVEMKLYEYALSQWYSMDVPEVNKRLVEAGVQPLTPLVEGYDEDGVRIAT